MRPSLLGIVMAGALVASSAHAQVDTVTVNVAASADSSVDRLFDWVNKGKATQLPANGYFKPEGERALFKFDLAQIRAAIGARTLVGARLVLQPAVPAWSFGASYVDAFRLTANWSETTVTWKSLFGTVDNFDPTSPTARAVLVDGSTAPVQFDVTKDVAAFIAGTAANYGWVIKDDGFSSGVATEYYSRESSQGRPVLIVESTDAPPSEIATLTFPEPGTVLVDSSTGKEIVDVPLHGRTFANIAAAANWAAATFNATLQRDASGAPIGATGESIQIGDLFYIDSVGNMIEIDDIVPVLLGGQDGIVTIAGTQYCVRPEICGEAFKAAPESDSECSRNFCANQESWWVKPAQRLWIYTTVGGELAQGAGGWQQKCGFCWRSFSQWFPIPTRVRCCKSSGSNQLTLYNTYLGHDDCTQSGCHTYYSEFSRTGSNTSSVKHRLFAVLTGKIGWKNGNVSGGAKPAGSEVDGVCSRGNASGTGGGSVSGIVTGAGKTIDSFCGEPNPPPLQ